MFQISAYEERAKGNILPNEHPRAKQPLGEHSFDYHIPAISFMAQWLSGIGIPSTSGCKLVPDDIAQLFQRVPVGTPVQIVNIPVKISPQIKRYGLKATDLKNGQNHF